jgi:hypothetical protein
LADVASTPQGLARMVERSRLPHQQLGGLQAHPAFRQRMLDRLVLADRPGEADAFGVVRVTSTIFGVLRGRGPDLPVCAS